ncbi:MAG: hypothetical protein RI955_897, partial [Bacteroidota bacterium]
AEILKHISDLSKISADERINQRIEKFASMGVVNEN